MIVNNKKNFRFFLFIKVLAVELIIQRRSNIISDSRKTNFPISPDKLFMADIDCNDTVILKYFFA